jgi:hypothetical protein
MPALASLRIVSTQGVTWGKGEEGGEGTGRLVRAFEAVGPTLRRLILRACCGEGAVPVPGALPAGAASQLGLAIGKLQRLRCLDLELSKEGRDYKDIARGMAASGGCPELFELRVATLESHVGSFLSKPSLIVPSVRDLIILAIGTEEEALLLCCGLVQMGYKHRLRMGLRDRDGDELRYSAVACTRAILRGAGIHAHVWSRCLPLDP